MIPDIGLMIAAYTITRLTAMLGQPNAQTNVIAKILAAISILLVAGAMVDLMGKGVTVPPAMR